MNPDGVSVKLEIASNHPWFGRLAGNQFLGAPAEHPLRCPEFRMEFDGIEQAVEFRVIEVSAHQVDPGIIMVVLKGNAVGAPALAERSEHEQPG